MTDAVRVPGPRDVRASLDVPDSATPSGSEDADTDSTNTGAAVVACPPHPRIGGDRRDGRLRAVSDALVDSGVACLRFDYGPWDEGRAEVTDARSALSWARERYATVGLFGYSFGGAVALRAAGAESEAGTPPAALSALAPAGTLAGESTTDAVDAVDCPLQVVYGERDDTVDSAPVAERARERSHAVETLPADHFFVGRTDRAAGVVVDFLSATLS